MFVANQPNSKSVPGWSRKLLFAASSIGGILQAKN